MLHRLVFFILSLGCLLVLLFFFSVRSEAGSLTSTILRLDRAKAGTATGGTVCAQTPASNNGTVAKVAVTFPSDFNVNSSNSNWTVTTSDLPAGASAWPGIAGATQVSGQTVTFPSSDLAQATFYCFNFSGSNTLTTGASAIDKTGSVATLTSGGLTIDYKTYALSIVSADQISVSATAPANPADFETNLSIDNSQDTYPQNATLYFTLKYRSNLSYSSNITLETEWSLGTVAGSSVPTVDILSYQQGSAGNAYGNAPVVVDPVNRKLDWTISSLPGNTEKTVTFQLRTTSTFTGVERVTFNVASRIIGLGTQTADSTVTKDYLYNFVPTQAPGPTATGTPAPTPSPSPPVLSFSDIEIQALSSKAVTIVVETNRDSTLRLSYGKSIRSLSQTLSSPISSSSHKISISDLSPDTDYFFRIRAQDQDGTAATSDIYTFRTASTSTPAEVDLSTLVFLSNNNLLTFNSKDFITSGKRPFVVIPINTNYQIRLSLVENQTAKRIKGILRQAQVLAAQTPGSGEGESIDLAEVQPGVYLGNLFGQGAAGLYELYVQVLDTKGNILEQKIADARVVKPLTILSKSGSPVENAIVLLYWYNISDKIYSLMPAAALGGKNPVNSSYSGVIPAVLGAGRYKADINALGYAKKTVEFAIGPGKGETYPQIMLEAEPFNLMTFITYYSGTLLDVFNSTVGYVNNLSLSIRFFDLIAAVSFILLVITVIFSFSLRTHMKIRHIPAFFLYNVEDLLGLSKERYVTGFIKDGVSGKPVSRTNVSLYDAKSKKLLGQVHSNKLGEFYMRKPAAKLYKIVIEKPGYIKLSVPDFLPNALTGRLIFSIQTQEEASKLTLLRIIKGGFENLVGFSFEFFLLAAVLLEFIFLRTRGLARTAPFILITLLTIIVWLFYAKRALGKIFASSESS